MKNSHTCAKRIAKAAPALLFTFGAVVWSASDIEESLLRKASMMITRGNQALHVGNLRKAEVRFGEALEILPDLPEGHLGLGRIAMQRKQFHQALAHFRETERLYRAGAANLFDSLHRRYHDSQVRATQIRRRVQMMEANIEVLDAIISESSSDSAARQREKLRTLQQDVRRQTSEARQLEKIQPPPEIAEEGVPGEVYFHIGNALRNLGRLEEAVDAWQACAERSPTHALTFNNLAVAYWKLGKFDIAMVNLEKAEALGFRVNRAFKTALKQSRASTVAP